MSCFLIALQFLTVIPLNIKKYSEERMAASAAYFPLAGLVIGVIVAGLYKALMLAHFPGLACDTIAVLLLAGITGGMHLDGLSDTADAFFSRKDKTGMLAIMRDPSVGALGALSITGALLLKIALLFSLVATLKVPGLIGLCVAARWSAVFQMHTFDYAREKGKATAFMKERKPHILIIATIFAAAILFAILKLPGIVLLSFICLVSFLQGWFCQKLLGGITGDTIGAGIEISEVAVLIYLNVLAHSFSA